MKRGVHKVSVVQVDFCMMCQSSQSSLLVIGIEFRSSKTTSMVVGNVSIGTVGERSLRARLS